MANTTNVSWPFALVRWGGCVPGQRPRTKLAFLERAVAKQGHVNEYRGRIWKGKAWARTPSTFARDDVLKQWRYPPRAATLKRARLALRTTPLKG